MIISLIAILILYAIVITIAEIFYKKGSAVKDTRKIAHIVAGVISFLLPVLMNLYMALLVGLLFALFLFWTKKKQILKSVHKIDNENYGVVCFPIGLMFCAVIFWNINPIIFQGSALILGLSDGLAGLFGQRFGKIRYNLTGDKTLGGSIVFFLVTSIILLSLLFLNKNTVGEIKILFVILGALVISVVEGVFGNGWDNLFIPISSGIVLYLIL